jgi:hypothetical protein
LPGNLQTGNNVSIPPTNVVSLTTTSTPSLSLSVSCLFGYFHPFFNVFMDCKASVPRGGIGPELSCNRMRGAHTVSELTSSLAFAETMNRMPPCLGGSAVSKAQYGRSRLHSQLGAEFFSRHFISLQFTSVTLQPPPSTALQIHCSYTALPLDAT